MGETEDACRGCLVGHVKIRGKKINDNVVSLGFAPVVDGLTATLTRNVDFAPAEAAIAA